MRKSAAVLLVIFHVNPKGAIFTPHFYKPGKLVATIEKPKAIKKDAVSVDEERNLLTGEHENDTNALQYDRSHHLVLQEE